MVDRWELGMKEGYLACLELTLDIVKDDILNKDQKIELLNEIMARRQKELKKLKGGKRGGFE